jgi:PD-(D/E)XK endonuclease
MNIGEIHQWKRFKTFKQRGEWVELQFMAQAASHGYRISKPWGDTASYDIGVENGPSFLRVQVKSTTVRTGTGYLCQFNPNYHRKQDYTVAEIDIFAAYIIPENIWYLIPSRLLLGPKRRHAVMLCPLVPLRKNRYSFEAYKEAWPLLGKSKRALAAQR